MSEVNGWTQLLGFPCPNTLHVLSFKAVVVAFDDVFHRGLDRVVALQQVKPASCVIPFQECSGYQGDVFSRDA